MLSSTPVKALAHNQNSWYRTLFSTSHKIILNRYLRRFYSRAKGEVLVLGAGKEAYGDLLISASSILVSDIDTTSSDVDMYIDAHSIPFEDSTFDCIVAVEILEHLHDPVRAASEIRRVLTPNGIAILSVPFMFHVHGDPHDYQRFTESGIQVLFNSFSQVHVIPFGSRVHVISDIVTTSSRLLVPFRSLNWLLTLPIFSSVSCDSPSGYVIFLEK